MADFKSQSLWIRLAFVMLTLGLTQYLFAYRISGWATIGKGFKICPSNGGPCSSNWVIPVEVCHVIAFFCSMTAFVLVLCIVFLDKLSGNKQCIIAFVVLTLLSALLIIIGDIIFRTYINIYAYSDCVTITCALIMLGAGIFGILELVGVQQKGGKKVNPKK